jgi:CspA family cold shock protein
VKERKALVVGVALTVAALLTSCGGSSARAGTDPTSTTAHEGVEAQFADPAAERCAAILARGGTINDCQATIGPVDGTVVSWNDDGGWGVLSSPAVDGEVWVHYSNIKGTSYRALREGEPVRFTYETVKQDGYPHRAVLVDRL